ncbi:MAG: amidase [Sphingomonadales bacterium]|nr:MAG: amidase [Sphingomonadales bacterium]
MAYPKLTDQPGALEIAAAIRAGEMSPHEAVEDAIARIEHLDVHVNAVAVCDFERAIETAKAMDGQTPRADQPLFGVPMTIKESFDIAGLPTCWGHKQYSENIAQRDSKLAAQLKAAGAVIVGKTNIPVDLSDWQSFNPVYGRTNNPHDHDRSPGGSSGGSAAAVASGMVPCDYGTDIGGSVRVPAHFCGVWGHKTTWSLISKHGHDHPAMAGSDGHDGALSIAGPIARNAQDVLALLDITMQMPLKAKGKPLSECRFLAILDHPDCPLDDGVREPLEAAIEAMGAAGLKIDHNSSILPDLAAQQENYLRMLNIAMARGAPGPNGERASATDWFDLLDKQAQNQIEWEAVFAEYDYVISAPAPVLAVPHRDEAVFRGILEINGREIPAGNGLAWPGLATFPHLPATSFPIGGHDGLPCNMQLMGPLWSDLDCVTTAAGIDAVLNR